MSDRFPTSADLRDAAAGRRIPVALRPLFANLADALDAGTIRWPEEEPAGTCGTCRYAGNLGGTVTCGAPGRRMLDNITLWRASSCDAFMRPKRGAPPCPGHAAKVKP